MLADNRTFIIIDIDSIPKINLRLLSNIKIYNNLLYFILEFLYSEENFLENFIDFLYNSEDSFIDSLPEIYNDLLNVQTEAANYFHYVRFHMQNLLGYLPNNFSCISYNNNTLILQCMHWSLEGEKDGTENKTKI